MCGPASSAKPCTPPGSAAGRRICDGTDRRRLETAASHRCRGRLIAEARSAQNCATGGPLRAACRDRPCLVARWFLDLNARLPDNPRLFRFPGSSVVERRTVNPLVGGSNPSRGATFFFGPKTDFWHPTIAGRNSNRRQKTRRFDDAAQRRRSPFRATPKG